MTQLVLSALAGIASIAIFSQALEVAIASPLLVQKTDVSPSVESVLALFSAQERGEVIGLTCPCSSPTAAFSTVVNVTWREDTFCEKIRREESDLGSELTQALREASTTALANACTRVGGQAVPLTPYTPELLDLIRATFGPNITDAWTINFIANAVSTGVCGSVFGIANKFTFTRADTMGFPSSSLFTTPCGPFSPLPLLMPQILGVSTQGTLDALVRLQVSRFSDLVTASARTCSELHIAQGQFLSDMAASPVNTPTALSPLALAALTRGLFDSLLSTRVNAFLGLVPGSLGARDLWTESPGLLTGGTSLPGFTPMGTPPELSDGDFILSSRLPFVRASTLLRSSGFFYVPLTRSSNTIPRWVTPFGGALRAVVLNVSRQGDFPFSIMNRLNTDPPWVPGVSNWLAVGDDTLTLMDACASGLPIAVDIFSLEPMGARPGYQDVGAFPDPWPEIFENLTLAGGAQGFCSRSRPHPTTRIPLQCPSIYTYMGKARRLSSYFRYNSSYRMPLDSYLAAFVNNATAAAGDLTDCFSLDTLPGLNAQQRAFCDRVSSGDLQDRIDLLRFLMFDSAGPNFATIPQAHYASCRPSSCTYTSIRPRTADELSLEAVGIYGGNVSAILSGFSFLAFTLSALGLGWDACPHRLKKKAGQASSPPEAVKAWGEAATLELNTVNPAQGKV